MSERRFAALILTHGRPGNVVTYRTLRRQGYTGRIVVVIDDEDETADEYRAEFGDEVYQFDKSAAGSQIDLADNLSGRGVIVFARNACWDIAADLGLTHFVQLDDDYHQFQYRYGADYRYKPKSIQSLDRIFDAMLGFIDATPALCVCMAQGGDFIGGEASTQAHGIHMMRKAMNSFVCRTDRRFRFPGRINEDVNAYTSLGSRGHLLVSTNQTTLEQVQTQASDGGMTGIYLSGGTFVKSFYTVMQHPSSVSIRSMGRKNRRIHHSVKWADTVPKILREELRKSG